jgi:hypothetical protein
MRIDITDPAGDRWEFDWDPVTGAVSGPDGWWVDRLLGVWEGFAPLAAFDQTVPSPRHSAPGMALFLMAQGFRPPDALRARLAPDQLPAIGADS